MILRLLPAMSMLAALSLAPPAHAQNVNVAPGRWTVDYGELRCSLARRVGDDASPIVVFSSYLGRDRPDLVLLGPESVFGQFRARRGIVMLMPSQERHEVEVVTQRRDDYRLVRMWGLGADFFDQLAAASSVQIFVDQRRIVDLPTPTAREGVAAFNACNDDLMESWGVDTVARNRLGSRPRLRAGTFTSDDYPNAAMARNQQGQSVARIDITAEGRPSACQIVISSQSPSLDQETCRLIMRRFRYEPGVGADGAPTASQTVYTVVWRLPD